VHTRQRTVYIGFTFNAGQAWTQVRLWVDDYQATQYDVRLLGPGSSPFQEQQKFNT